jgi:hypothetical protein
VPNRVFELRRAAAKSPLETQMPFERLFHECRLRPQSGRGMKRFDRFG